MAETGVFRLAGPGDAAAIRDLTRAADAKWVPLIGREPKPMGADYAAAVRAHRFDLLEVDGVLTGLVETIAAADHLLIENVAVAPAFQGRGLGRRLLARAEAVAASGGISEMRLYTNRMFLENIALYRRIGYAVLGEEDVGVGVVVHMGKRVGV